MINAPSQAAAAAQSGANNAVNSTNTAAATAASDFDSFLKLLTAQMRNQDPLAPLDSTQFVEQLASFSSVEQQIATNEKLDALTSSLAGSGLQAATPWIGQNVEVASSAVRFSGEAATFGMPESSVGDTQREFVVKNSRGDVVYREPLSSSVRQFTWDGKTINGQPAEHGDYSIDVNFIADGKVAETKPPLTTVRVTEARLMGGDVKLSLSNGAVVGPNDILALKAVDEAAPLGQ